MFRNPLTLRSRSTAHDDWPHEVDDALNWHRERARDPLPSLTVPDPKPPERRGVPIGLDFVLLVDRDDRPVRRVVGRMHRKAGTLVLPEAAFEFRGWRVRSVVKQARCAARGVGSTYS